MKRYIRTSTNLIRKHFDIIVDIVLDSPYGSGTPIAAADYEVHLPTGELLPPEKDAIINSQALEDYHAFIESVERLLTRYYDLEVYYKNDSDDHSFYFGMLAKNSDGTLLLDFDFTLRISTHPGHNSPESRYNKRQQDSALKQIAGDNKPLPLFESVLVNNTKFHSYEEAYFKINSIVRHKVSIMERRKDWKRKKAKKRKRK